MMTKLKLNLKWLDIKMLQIPVITFSAVLIQQQVQQVMFLHIFF